MALIWSFRERWVPLFNWEVVLDFVTEDFFQTYNLLYGVQSSCVFSIYKALDLWLSIVILNSFLNGLLQLGKNCQRSGSFPHFS